MKTIIVIFFCILFFIFCDFYLKTLLNTPVKQLLTFCNTFHYIISKRFIRDLIRSLLTLGIYAGLKKNLNIYKNTFFFCGYIGTVIRDFTFRKEFKLLFF